MSTFPVQKSGVPGKNPRLLAESTLSHTKQCKPQ